MAVCEVVSATCAVKVNGPELVGVPDRVPFGAIVTPIGKFPVFRLQVYGVAPPVAARAMV